MFSWLKDLLGKSRSVADRRLSSLFACRSNICYFTVCFTTLIDVRRMDLPLCVVQGGGVVGCWFWSQSYDYVVEAVLHTALLHEEMTVISPWHHRLPDTHDISIHHNAAMMRKPLWLTRGNVLVVWVFRIGPSIPITETFVLIPTFPLRFSLLHISDCILGFALSWYYS